MSVKLYFLLPGGEQYQVVAPKYAFDKSVVAKVVVDYRTDA
jgi:hypothetical protein